MVGKASSWVDIYYKWSSVHSYLYITEIARPDLRGSLLSTAATLTSLGMLITYAEGAFMSWRLVAWLNIIYTLVPVVLIQLYVPSNTRLHRFHVCITIWITYAVERNLCTQLFWKVVVRTCFTLSPHMNSSNVHILGDKDVSIKGFWSLTNRTW